MERYACELCLSLNVTGRRVGPLPELVDRPREHAARSDNDEAHGPMKVDTGRPKSTFRKSLRLPQSGVLSSASYRKSSATAGDRKAAR